METYLLQIRNFLSQAQTASQGSLFRSPTYHTETQHLWANFIPIQVFSLLPRHSLQKAVASPNTEITSTSIHSMRRLLLDNGPTAASARYKINIAVMCALCILTLYAAVKCICQCARRRQETAASIPVNQHHHHHHHHHVTATMRLDAPTTKQQLNSIPVLKYDRHLTPSSSSPALSTRETGTSEVEVCPVCLAEFAEGDEVRVLPRCEHVFHKECIDRWLLTRSSFCPICRDRVIRRTLEPTMVICEPGRNDSNGGNSNGRAQPVVVLSHTVASPYMSGTIVS